MEEKTGVLVNKTVSNIGYEQIAGSLVESTILDTR